MPRYTSRLYNGFEIDQHHVIKSSSNDKLRDEIEYYKTIESLSGNEFNYIHHGQDAQHVQDRSILKTFFPRYLNSWYTFNDGRPVYNLQLERLNYNNLWDVLRNDNNIFSSRASVVIQSLFDILDILHAVPVKKSSKYYQNIEYNLNEMFVLKTEREYAKILENIPSLGETLSVETLWISGVQYKNFDVVWEQIKNKHFNTLDDSFQFQREFIHGDLCFNNIMVNDNNGDVDIKFIDMRGSFGTIGTSGDARYDYAKLYHSSNGMYEHIINDEFQLTIETPQKFYYKLQPTSVLEQTRYDEFTNKLVKKLKDENISLSFILAVAGTIFIGMIPRQYVPSNTLEGNKRVLAMYLTGIRLLNEALL